VLIGLADAAPRWQGVCYLSPAMDWHTRQWRMQIAVYSLYRHAIGRPWHYPTLPAEPKSWEVTKSLRGIGVNFCDRTIWLIVPMVIERVPIDNARHEVRQSPSRRRRKLATAALIAR
jgi:hypothetical protein